MPISFGSINTGLPKDIVQQIMASERIPIQKMESRKSNINSKVELVNEITKLVEDLKGDLLSISSPKDLQEFKVETNNELIDVIVDKNIATSSITQMEVLNLARKSSAMTNGVADKDETYFGVGFLQYTLPDGTEKEIYIDKDHSSLTGIAHLINSDDSNGMKANVVNDGKDTNTPWRLLINLEETGDRNNADFPYFYLIDGYEDLYLDNERSANDARYKVNGFELESPTNKVKELLPGVTVDLKKAKPGEEFYIKITEDIKAVSEKIENLIEKINAVLKFIKDQNSLDENSDTSKTLGGDITLINSNLQSRQITRQLSKF